MCLSAHKWPPSIFDLELDLCTFKYSHLCTLKYSYLCTFKYSHLCTFKYSYLCPFIFVHIQTIKFVHIKIFILVHIQLFTASPINRFLHSCIKLSIWRVFPPQSVQCEDKPLSIPFQLPTSAKEFTQPRRLGYVKGTLIIDTHSKFSFCNTKGEVPGSILGVIHKLRNHFWGSR